MYQCAIPDLVAYQNAYQAFRAAAASFSAPYLRNLRSVDVLTSTTLATTDTGTGKVKPWFQPSTTLQADPSRVSPAKIFNVDGKVPSSSFFGVYGAAVLMSMQYGTITQRNTMLAAVGAADINLQVANETILQWKVGRCIASFTSGYLVSTDNAATPLVAAAGYEQVCVTPLPWPKNLNPSAQIVGDITYTAASIPADLDLTLLLHCFAGDIGTG